MAVPVLVVYIVLLLVGGVFGYLKAGSRVSLFTAVPFAVALAICIFLRQPLGLYLALGLQAILLVVFALRFSKTRKFMPAGLMVGATALAMLLELALRSGATT
jgi:uncharacterized membrane protein (UPF0136 family)